MHSRIVQVGRYRVERQPERENDRRLGAHAGIDPPLAPEALDVQDPARIVWTVLARCRERARRAGVERPLEERRSSERGHRPFGCAARGRSHAAEARADLHRPFSLDAGDEAPDDGRVAVPEDYEL